MIVKTGPAKTGPAGPLATAVHDVEIILSEILWVYSRKLEGKEGQVRWGKEEGRRGKREETCG